MRARITPGDGDPRHGTLNGYSNLCCRCDECRAVGVAYSLQMRQRRAEWAKTRELIHGDESTYFNYKCRCDECRRAHAIASRERAWRRRERAS